MSVDHLKNSIDRTRIIRHCGAIAKVLCALPMLVCLVGANPGWAAPKMDIIVAEVDMYGGTFSVSMSISDWSGDTDDLRTVPIYVDNPYALAAGELFENYRYTKTDQVHISYTIRPAYVSSKSSETYTIRLPFMNQDRAWLLGNHVFVTPILSADFVTDLRRDLPINLTFELPDDVPLLGVPEKVQLHNLHELMSLQFGFGAFDVVGGQGENWDWEIYLEDGGGFSPEEMTILTDRMAYATEAAAELFGGAPFPSVGMLLVRDNFMSGLEGTYGFQTSLPPKIDLSAVDEPLVGSYFGTLVHELVHSWLPIRLFAVDDVWLKEGVTSYYGDLLAARAGWISVNEIRKINLRYQYMVHGDTELEQVALSDPQLWYEEYTSESWRRVTYERGLAVSILLDVLLRESTQNEHSLDDVMKLLFAEHVRGTIDRHELLRAIYESTGVYATEFFAKYVDSTTAPSLAEVEEGLNKLIELGAYSVR